MQPWMIIAVLMGLGVVTLLVAPRLHRRSLSKARSDADEHRRARIEEIRSLPTSAEREFPSAESANAARHALILRGVRSEVFRSVDGRHLLVHDAADRDSVEVVIRDLD